LGNWLGWGLVTKVTFETHRPKTNWAAPWFLVGPEKTWHSGD
jgi:hypothetical protein